MHSGLLGPIRAAAQKADLTLESLLVALGDTVRLRQEPADLERICVGLQEKRHARVDRLQLTDVCGLLRMGGERNREMITNSLKGVGDTLEEAKVLAVKAGLPLVLWASIDYYPPEEDFMAAEYLYHDERFVVVRGLFSSVDLFAKVLASYKELVNIFAFDAAAPEAVATLERGKDQWRGRAEILFFDSISARVNFMFSSVYQIAVQHGTRDILFSGIDIDKLAAVLPERLRVFGLFVVVPMPLALEGIGFRRIEPENPFELEAKDAQWPRFDVVVLLSMPTMVELNSFVNRLSPPGVVIDFTSLSGADLTALVGEEVRIYEPRLHEAVSAEFWNLLKIRRSR
jgi:hypothetical protein